MERGFQYWLRWIGVLPLSLIAAILIDFPLHWVLYRILSGGDNPFVTPYPELPEKILAPFCRALILVWLASKIAPEHKFKTSVVIASLWIFGAGASFVLGYLGITVGSEQAELIGGGLPVAMGVVGAILGLYLVKGELSEDLTPQSE